MVCIKIEHIAYGMHKKYIALEWYMVTGLVRIVTHHKREIDPKFG